MHEYVLESQKIKVCMWNQKGPKSNQISSISNRLVGYKWQLLEYASGVPRGRGEDSPPPEIGKIVVEIWCYLPEVYTLGAESDIQEIFSKKLWKKSIFHRDFDQKSQNFLEVFQNSLHFWSKRAKFCRHLAKFYLPNRNPALDLDYLAFFYKLHSIFS